MNNDMMDENIKVSSMYVDDTGSVVEVGGYSQVPVDNNQMLDTTTITEDFTPVVVKDDTPASILPTTDDATIKSIAALVANLLGTNLVDENQKKLEQEKTKRTVVISLSLLAIALLLFFTFKK